MSFYSCLTCDATCSHKKTIKTLFKGCDSWERVVAEIDCDDDFLYKIAMSMPSPQDIEMLNKEIDDIESQF